MPTSVSGAVEIGSDSAIDLAEVEGRFWASWHLYEIAPDDYPCLVSSVIPPIVEQLSALSLVDRFFFVRYADEGGHHVRLRCRSSQRISIEVDQAMLVVKDIAAGHGLTVLPRSFELEVERYGGLEHLPLSLEFFCLSSMAALAWFECCKDVPRPRQLTAQMGLLVDQAVASARSLAELATLLNYFAGRPARVDHAVQHGDSAFASRQEEFLSWLRLRIEGVLSVTPSTILVEGARALSAEVLGLRAEARTEVLLSQVHMTANRLGLRNSEESYLTRILLRSLSELIRKDPNYARELDARLGRQQSAARLDSLIGRSMEA